MKNYTKPLLIHNMIRYEKLPLESGLIETKDEICPKIDLGLPCPYQAFQFHCDDVYGIGCPHYSRSMETDCCNIACNHD